MSELHDLAKSVTADPLWHAGTGIPLEDAIELVLWVDATRGGEAPSADIRRILTGAVAASFKQGKLKLTATEAKAIRNVQTQVSNG